MDYCHVNAIVTSIKAPLPNIIKITDSIQPSTGKYSVVIDLADMSNVYFNSLLDTVCLHLPRDTIIQAYLATRRLPQHPRDHTVFAGTILTECIQLSLGAQV